MPDQISVSEFVAETHEDYKAPTASSFTTPTAQCRDTVAAIEEILLPAERPQSYSGDYALSCAPYPACHHLQLVPVSKDEVAGMLLPAPL